MNSYSFMTLIPWRNQVCMYPYQSVVHLTLWTVTQTEISSTIWLQSQVIALVTLPNTWCIHSVINTGDQKTQILTLDIRIYQAYLLQRYKWYHLGIPCIWTPSFLELLGLWLFLWAGSSYFIHTWYIHSFIDLLISWFKVFGYLFTIS